MLTTTAGGRVWNFSRAIGRNALAGNGFTQPTSLALAPGGVIYVVSRGQEGADPVIIAENRRVGKLTMDEEFLGDFAKKEITWAAGIAVSQDENVYIACEYANNINIYSSDGERIGEWGEPGSGEGQLDGPSGIVFDEDENLYIADGRNNRVQKFTKDGRFLTAWGSEGSGDGQFSLPWGITIDQNGDVYVVDWQNNRVQKFTPAGEFLMSFGPTDDEALRLDRPATWPWTARATSTSATGATSVCRYTTRKAACSRPFGVTPRSSPNGGRRSSTRTPTWSRHTGASRI